MDIKRIQFIIGIVILILYIWRLNVVESLANLKEEIKWFYLAIAFLMCSFILMVRAVRWEYIARKLGIENLNFSNSLKYTSASFFISLLTPGKVGEASRMLFMKKSKKAEVLAGVTIEYSFDALVLVLLPICFSLIFLYRVELFLGILTSMLVFLVPVVILLKKGSMERFAKIFILKNTILKESKETYTRLLARGLKEKYIVGACFFSSLSIYLIMFSAMYVSFLSISVQIDIITVFAGLAIGQLIGVISFIPMGLGSRELGSLGFFVFMGYDPVVIGSALIVARLLTLSPLIISYAFYLMLTLGEKP